MTLERLRDQVHVWLLRPEEQGTRETLAQYQAVLCEQELRRHRRYLRRESRQAFVLAHGALRRVLSGYAPDVEPEQWRFETGLHGRPEIDSPRALRNLRFNLSHTRGLIALVVTDGLDCGIDVEETGGVTDVATDVAIDVAIDVARIAERVFSPRELDNLRAQPAGAMRRRFHEFWTLKEAYIKATGLGLAQDLREFAFEIASTGEVAVHFAPSIQDDPSRWQFECGQPTANHQMALAVRLPDGHLRQPLPVRVRTIGQ